ncbi:MAG TPA: hypothetical protein VG758_25670 [Hyphomicrobiaceae bacterium]|jgi:hypothetical protein|nr:hypothetical protein [Hyphomicrobiaceae bacterium]
MIHRQERRSLFGFSVARHIDLEDAQTIIAAIKETPADRPIDLVLHTPGGLVLAAMQITRSLDFSGIGSLAARFGGGATPPGRPRTRACRGNSLQPPQKARGKLGVRNRVQAVAEALRQQVIP